MVSDTQHDHMAQTQLGGTTNYANAHLIGMRFRVLKYAYTHNNSE